MCEAIKLLLVVSCLACAARHAPAQQPVRLDPAAWGSDHVGRPAQAFTSGDQCPFCHRMDVGPTWSANRHGQTVRTADPESEVVKSLAKSPELKAIAAEIDLLMGRNSRVRYLKRSAEHGKLDLLSIARPHWDSRTFGARCAGCHATGTDSAKQTFSAISHDCFVCHGEPPEKHTTEGRLVFLSPHRKDSAAVVTSICAQCHLRTGASRSTGLPYPNNFVAGDNLFRDFQVDLSNAAIQRLNPADRHVQENVRDVVLLGREGVTCLSCHDIHKQSSRKHHTVSSSGICLNCHGTGSKKERIPYEVHSPLCGY
jgi:predicted CXXCH cytochrome family protein